MKQLITTIEQSGWTGLILYGISFLVILLFMELHNKRQDKLFVNGFWVNNDYDPIGFRVFFAGCIFFGSIALFFTIRYFIK